MALRWFQTDTDTPNDPKVKAWTTEGLKRAGSNRAAQHFGHLVLLWCYIGNHGQGLPGLGVREDGSPLSLQEMAEECFFDSVDDLMDMLTFMAARGHVDAAMLEQRGVVFLPAMAKRADSYARSKGRAVGPGLPGLTQDGPYRTEQDKTSQHTDLLENAGETHADKLINLWNQHRKRGPEVLKHRKNPTRWAAFGRAFSQHPKPDDWALVIAWIDRQTWCNAPGTGEYPTFRMSLDILVKPGKFAAYFEQAKASQRPGKPGQAAGRDASRGRTGVTPGKFKDLGGDGDQVH